MPRGSHFTTVCFLVPQVRGESGTCCVPTTPGHPSLPRKFPNKLLLPWLSQLPRHRYLHQHGKKQLSEPLHEEPSQQPSCSAAEPLGMPSRDTRPGEPSRGDTARPQQQLGVPAPLGMSSCETPPGQAPRLRLQRAARSSGTSGNPQP